MKICINGTPTCFKNVDAMPLMELVVRMLDQHEDEIKGVAVAVDERVVPRSKWAHVLLCGQEHVEIITATQGG